LLLVVAAVAVVAGGSALIRGPSEVIGAAGSSNNVDSEFRFFAAWYVIAGVLLFRAIPSVERQGWIIRAVAGGFFLAGFGRVLSILEVGPPHWWYVVLMTIELALPVILVTWQAFVARRTPAP
jgi:uncharacterized protein DUF4345